MARVAKDQLRRDRLREYEAALAAARPPVEVLVMFARGRERRSAGRALEEAFAETAVSGVEDAQRLPAAVWVALRQGDVTATIEALLRAARTDFLVAVREELDSGYRLTSVEERRPLPDVELLQAQLAAFLQVPPDVVSIIAGWGPDDPRTGAEIDALLQQRFGPVVEPGSSGHRPAAAGPVAPSGGEPTAAGTGPVTPDRSRMTRGGPTPSGTEPAPTGGRPAETTAPSTSAPAAGLLMSSTEFSAMLSLTPDQQGVLAALARQTDITIVAG